MDEGFRDIDDDEVDKLVADDNRASEDFAALLAQNEKLVNEVLELKDSDTPDEIRVKCRTFAINNLESALTKIANLVNNAEKDSTQLSAARTIVNIAQGTTAKDEADPLASLFEKLAKG